MKSYLPIIASLFLASTSFTLPIIASEKQIITQAISPHIKENIARQITVQVSNGKTSASGVIVGKYQNTYLVLTNRHSFYGDKNPYFTKAPEIELTTNKGVIYEAFVFYNSHTSSDDFLLIGFESDRDYQVAEINSAAKPTVGKDILLTGYDPKTGALITDEGKIAKVEERSFGGGYSLGLSNDSGAGTIGGAILNTHGELIGINGRNAFSVNHTGFIYDDSRYADPIEPPRRSPTDSIDEGAILTPIKIEERDVFGRCSKTGYFG